jgi:hypothetical protein
MCRTMDRRCVIGHGQGTIVNGRAPKTGWTGVIGRPYDGDRYTMTTSK